MRTRSTGSPSLRAGGRVANFKILANCFGRRFCSRDKVRYRMMYFSQYGNRTKQIDLKNGKIRYSTLVLFLCRLHIFLFSCGLGFFELDISWECQTVLLSYTSLTPLVKHPQSKKKQLHQAVYRISEQSYPLQTLNKLILAFATST